ncbi:MAG: hypothetical protein RIS64_2597 [Bacteroidota bacterium]|jgi:hypothetical protein
MMKKMIYCLLGLVNLFACGEKSAKKPATVATPVVTRPLFASKTSIDTIHEDIPRTVVSIIWQEQIMKIDTMIGAFQPVDTSQYVRHRIPKTAIATGTGFWAGLETTYVIDSTANGWVVMRKYEDEGGAEAENGAIEEPYEILKTLPFQKIK